MTAAGAIRLVWASRNAGKLAEVRALLAGVADVALWEGAAAFAFPAEDGATYEENAFLKAQAVAAAAGLPALADDSGLEVDALGGRPGVHSSRYAGPACDPAANNARLLEELANIPETARGARFVCVAALAAPDGRRWSARGECRGRIARVPSGGAGFGYDPLFIPDGYAATFAALPAAEKNRISHRARAFRALGVYIPELARP